MSHVGMGADIEINAVGDEMGRPWVRGPAAPSLRSDLTARHAPGRGRSAPFEQSGAAQFGYRTVLEDDRSSLGPGGLDAISHIAAHRRHIDLLASGL